MKTFKECMKMENVEMIMDYDYHMGEFGELAINDKHVNEFFTFINNKFIPCKNNDCTNINTLSELCEFGEPTLYHNKKNHITLLVYNDKDTKKIIIHLYFESLHGNYKGDNLEYRTKEYTLKAIENFNGLL